MVCPPGATAQLYPVQYSGQDLCGFSVLRTSTAADVSSICVKGLIRRTRSFRGGTASPLEFLLFLSYNQKKTR